VTALLAPADAARLLDRGGVVLLPTDTLPGLHARVDRPAALARLAELKGRTEAKPLLVLAGSVAAVGRVAAPLTPRQEAYARRCWPGPFSLILTAAPGLAAAARGPGGTVAVRVPRPEALRKLLTAVGVPLASTSANRAGQAPAADLAAATALFAGLVDGACDPGDPPAPGNSRPSTLIDLTVWPPRVLREGPQTPPDALDLPGGAS
jgi:L-threonylcarbamoyladenylate synthase